jgi:hypothetical protein
MAPLRSQASLCVILEDKVALIPDCLLGISVSQVSIFPSELHTSIHLSPTLR